MIVPSQKNTSPKTTHTVAAKAFQAKLICKNGIVIKLIQQKQAAKIKIHPIFVKIDFFIKTPTNTNDYIFI